MSGVPGRDPIRSHIALASILALVTGLAIASRAAAYDYPLLPHLGSIAFFPPTPDDQHPTTALLSAYFTTECWRVLNSGMPDSSRLWVALERNPVCDDSAHTWTQSFALGQLAAGPHALHVTVYLPGINQEGTAESTTVAFDVVHLNSPPPPPPGDTTGTLVLSVSIDPPVPLVGEAVSLHLQGRFPYECGEVANATVVDTANLAMTLRPGPACTDTSLRWEQSFSLGVLPVGAHHYLLDVTIEGSPGRTSELLGINVTVTDPNAPPPPPPPPPGDSLKTVMSATRPNPFSEQTRFSVSLAEPVPAEVAIFDVGGRRVATVFRGTLPRGTSELIWNGHRSDGTAAPGGLYFYRLTLPDRIVTRRVVRLGTP